MEANFYGRLDNFRSLMLYLHSRHGGTEWTLPSGTRLVIQEYPCSDPTLQMMSWVVSIPLEVEGPNRRHAVIQAFSRDKNSTVVLLEDCRIISFGEISPNKVQVLDPDRAIGPPLFDELCQELQRQMDAWAPPPTVPQAQGNPALAKDSGDGHFAYPPDKRREIVRHYRAGRQKGIIANKDRWARHNYNISGKTLKRYEDEFPEPSLQTPADT